MNLKQGFTLVELLITIAAISIMAVVATNVLYTTVEARAKQNALANSSEELRSVIQILTSSIQSATNATVTNATTLSITSSPCRTIRQTGAKLEMAIDSSESCVPPTTNFSPITSDKLTVSTFTLNPVGSYAKYVNITLNGNYKDNLGLHNFNYQTTAYPRIN